MSDTDGSASPGPNRRPRTRVAKSRAARCETLRLAWRGIQSAQARAGRLAQVGARSARCASGARGWPGARLDKTGNAQVDASRLAREYQAALQGFYTARRWRLGRPRRPGPHGALAGRPRRAAGRHSTSAARPPQVAAGAVVAVGASPPMPDKFGSSQAGSGRCRPSLPEGCLSLARIREELAGIGPRSVDFGRACTKCDQSWPDSARFRSKSARVWSTSTAFGPS